MARVAALIFHPPLAADAGPLTTVFDGVRRTNAERLCASFTALGATARIVEDEGGERTFGRRLRDAARADRAAEGWVVLGSGAIPLATTADVRRFVAVAAGPPGRALANNRYSADVVAVAGGDWLAELPDLPSDNLLPRWLEEAAGCQVDDARRSWRLQVDLDSPLDAVLVGRPVGDADGAVRDALARVAAVAADPHLELLVAGRTSAGSVGWLERHTASRTRALVEERGFRTRPSSQRPVRSTLGALLERDGPEALGSVVASLGDAALIDSRVLLAQQFGADERDWPAAEDRFASDLLLAERIRDPWLRSLTISARDASIPIVLGGHSLVGPGIRLALRGRRAWT